MKTKCATCGRLVGTKKANETSDETVLVKHRTGRSPSRLKKVIEQIGGRTFSVHRKINKTVEFVAKPVCQSSGSAI